jgi:hypothetical protein
LKFLDSRLHGNDRGGFGLFTKPSKVLYMRIIYGKCLHLFFQKLPPYEA